MRHPIEAAASVDIGDARIACLPLRKDDASGRHDHRLSPGGPAVHRQADRAAAEFRRPGGDRNGERAAASPRRARPWSSRPRPPRYCRSSTPRPAISRRCSMRSWRRRKPCARRLIGMLSYLRRRVISARRRCAACLALRQIRFERAIFPVRKHPSGSGCSTESLSFTSSMLTAKRIIRWLRVARRDPVPHPAFVPLRKGQMLFG